MHSDDSDLLLLLLLLILLLLLLAGTLSGGLASLFCQHQYVLTPIQMHYAVSDVVLQQEAHI